MLKYRVESAEMSEEIWTTRRVISYNFPMLAGKKLPDCWKCSPAAPLLRLQLKRESMIFTIVQSIDYRCDDGREHI